MVYDITTINTELADLLGFTASESFALPASLTAPAVKMNNYHPLLQLSILDNVRPTGVPLSDWLVEMRTSAIQALLNDLVTTKLSGSGIKSKLADSIVFDSTARFTNLEPNLSKFVGWSFRPIKSGNLTHTISKIALQTLEPVTNLPIYVYHSSQLEEVTTRTITTTKPTSVNWVDLEEPITLNYTDQDNGGYYIIGYYQNDLVASSSSNNRAIYKDHDLSKTPCSGCNPSNSKYYNQWSQFMKIDTLYIDEDKQDGTNMVSTDKVSFDSTKNYGLNFKIESACNITNFLVENKSVLIPTLQKKYAIELIRYVDMSPLRKNAVTDTMKNEAFVALHGSIGENGVVKVQGLIGEYDKYMKALNLDTSLLDPVCLASTRTGIRWN